MTNDDVLTSNIVAQALFFFRDALERRPQSQDMADAIRLYAGALKHWLDHPTPHIMYLPAPTNADEQAIMDGLLKYMDALFSEVHLRPVTIH